MFTNRTAFLWVMICSLAIGGTNSNAAKKSDANAEAKPEHAAPVVSPLAAPLAALAEQLIREQAKEDYVDDDDWGKTRDVTVRYDMKGTPFDWKLKPAKKEVNDGLWERYRVRLVEPDEHLHLKFTRLEMLPGGRIAFELVLSAKVFVTSRVERWRQGIKMLNASAEAEAVVQVVLSGDIGFKMVPGDLLPAVAVDPKITDVDLKLLAFDLQRLSKLDGDAAHELGDSLFDTIKKNLNRREKKLAAKLNKSIAKRQDKLRISPEDFAKSGWKAIQEPGRK